MKLSLIIVVVVVLLLFYYYFLLYNYRGTERFVAGAEQGAGAVVPAGRSAHSGDPAAGNHKCSI